jgi:Fe-S-cluster-containing hydrogenase component 2
MRIALFTFSGTGNTMLAAAMLCDSFRSLGAEAESCPIEKLAGASEIPDISNTDALGIGYPIYAFNAPKLVVDFVKSLPPSDGKLAFIYKTAGEPFCWNASSSASIIRHLKRKGYRVVFERHFLMPYNILSRYPDALAKQMVITTGKLCLDMAERILSGEVSLPRLTFASRLMSFVFLIQRPGAALNGRFCSTNKNCNRCMKCVKNCPTKNIGFENGRILFHWKCIMCMRCVMYCPQNAIRFGLISYMAVNGPYEYEKIISDANISSEYVNEKTKGYFRLFKKYYRWAGKITNKPAER